MSVDVTPDPRPAKRIKATVVGWEQIKRAKMSPCRVCRTRQKWLTAHHLVGKDLGGDDVADNIVFLCGDGTTGCHGLVETRDPVACGKLRASLTEAELLYVSRKKGWDFLDRYYSPLVGGAGEASDGATSLSNEREPQATTVASAESPSGPSLPSRSTTEREPQATSSIELADSSSVVSDAPRSSVDQPSRSSTCPECGQTVKAKSGTAAEPPVETREKPRRKKSWRIAVPDDAEDGKAVLDGLVEACRVELAPTLGYEDERVPPYFVLTAVMAAFLRGERAAA